jgi:hypothetical protein
LGKSRRTPKVPLAASKTWSTTADRGFRLDCCDVAPGDLPVERNRQIGFDPQFIDPGDREDVALLVDVLPPDSARSVTTPSSGLRIVLSSRAA